MERLELQTILRNVSAGLSTKDLIPVFSCFCFTGKRVFAYDDVVAIDHPLATEFVGGIRGKQLLSYLAASRTKEVVFEVQGESALIKLGKSKLTLPLIAPADFVFKFPKTDKPGVIAIQGSEALIEGIAACATTLGTDPARPWMLGVTCSIGLKELTCYSSDSTSATRAVISQRTTGAADEVAVLPPKFVSLLIALCSKHDLATLFVDAKKGWVLAKFSSGLRLWSKLVDESNQDAYERVFSSMTKKAEKSFVEIPKAFSALLDRALVAVDGDQKKRAEFNVAEGKLVVRAGNQRADFVERTKLGKHPEIEMATVPDLLRGAIDGLEDIAFTESAVVVKSDSVIRIVQALA